MVISQCTKRCPAQSHKQPPCSLRPPALPPRLTVCSKARSLSLTRHTCANTTPPDCYVRARPVYIGLPTDMAFQKVDASRLKTKIDISLPPNDAETEAEVVKKIRELMYRSSNTVILSDACAIRHRVLGELHELMEKTKLPSFVSPMGKGSINETSEQFGGVYVGDVSRDDVKKRIEEA